MRGREYVAGVATATGFTILRLEEKTQEHHVGRPRPGLVVSLRRSWPVRCGA
jgi:hypothetical protein